MVYLSDCFVSSMEYYTSTPPMTFQHLRSPLRGQRLVKTRLFSLRSYSSSMQRLKIQVYSLFSLLQWFDIYWDIDMRQVDKLYHSKSIQITFNSLIIDKQKTTLFALIYLLSVKISFTSQRAHNISKNSYILRKFHFSPHFFLSFHLPSPFSIPNFIHLAYTTQLDPNFCNSSQFHQNYIFNPRFPHMHTYRKQVEHDPNPNTSQHTPRHSDQDQPTVKQNLCNPHVAFQKNYPKNIFIPLIQHLSEKGLKESYEGCVGTRQSFQGKNVVSLADIHKVLSQEWFTSSINLTALVSNMSNKILMNSKIKKKLFHLLLIRQLFSIPLQDPKQFKKQVSKKANQISQRKITEDSLFNYPSALIYLLRLFASYLESGKEPDRATQMAEDLPFPDQPNKICTVDQHSNLNRQKQKEQPTSKQEYKLYLSKIIHHLNAYKGDPTQLLDLLDQLKFVVAEREVEIRGKYKLPLHVPQWSHFSSIVISNCQLTKRNKQKVTFSLLNQWIQEFKQASTTLWGFNTLTKAEQPSICKFKPIVLIAPPTAD